MSEAQYIVVISSRTGWDEEYIRWWLPMSRGWSYYHAARLLDGERQRFPGCATRADAWFDQVEDRIGMLRNRKRKP